MMLRSKTIDEFINELASSSPAPGGGSVASLAGALGAALTSMVCNLTIGKKKYVEVQAEMESIVRRSESLRSSLTALIDEDTNAFNVVMNAFAMRKETENEKRERTDAIQRATKDATLVPFRVMQLCEQAMPLIRLVAEKGNVNSISDAGVAALMMSAGCMSAKLNVQINLASLLDAAFVRETRTQIEEIGKRVELETQNILQHVNTTLNTHS